MVVEGSTYFLVRHPHPAVVIEDRFANLDGDHHLKSKETLMLALERSTWKQGVFYMTRDDGALRDLHSAKTLRGGHSTAVGGRGD